MTQVQINDWRGVPIVPGSIIVYPGRKGSYQWMMEAEVIEIIQEWYYGSFRWALRVQPLRQGLLRVNMTPVKLTALERVTVVKNPSEVTA